MKNPSKRAIATVGAFVLIGGGLVQPTQAQFEVYALRKGDGVAVSGSAQAHHLDHFSGSAGSLNLQDSWSAPSSDPDTRITQGGSFATYSQLTISPGGGFLSFVGRAAAVDDSVGSSDHVVGVFNRQTETFDTSTRIPLTNVEHQNGGRGFRGAFTTDGNDLWFTGRNDGVYHATIGSDASTSVANSWQYNMIGHHDGDLHVSRRAGSTHGIHRWDGMPTTNAGGAAVRFADEGSGWDADNGQYGIFDFVGDTLFVSSTYNGPDEISVYVNAGPDVWNRLDGAGQSLTNTITGMPHLSAMDMGDHVQLFYTNDGGAENNSIYSVTWDPATQTFGTPIHLADAGTGYTFAGVQAIPEPSTYALLFGLGVMGLALAVRRRKRL